MVGTVCFFHILIKRDFVLFFFLCPEFFLHTWKLFMACWHLLSILTFLKLIIIMVLPPLGFFLTCGLIWNICSLFYGWIYINEEHRWICFLLLISCITVQASIRTCYDNFYFYTGLSWNRWRNINNSDY